MPFAFYNDTDEYCCEWLENLISARIIPYGVVDSTPIQRLKPEKLSKFTQVHLFAGMGGWPYALRLAQWPDSRPVWTGSCPCQPFSVAGKGKGTKDKRHLWPYMRRLINHASPKPPVCFGEQVSGAAGLLWLSRVRVDLEALAYEVGAVDSCAAGVGAPHIRQRLWWVADHANDRWRQKPEDTQRSNGGVGEKGRATGFALRSYAGRLADYQRQGLEGREKQPAWEERAAVERGGGTGGVVVTPLPTGEGFKQQPQQLPRIAAQWAEVDIIPCLDGKHRRIKSGLLPLAHGISSRISKLRAIGNTIVPQLAAEFILAYLEINP